MEMMALKRNKTVSVSVSEQELQAWKDAVPQTQYKSVSEFVREVINMTIEVIYSNEGKQMVIQVEDWEH